MLLDKNKNIGSKQVALLVGKRGGGIGHIRYVFEARTMVSAVLFLQLSVVVFRRGG